MAQHAQLRIDTCLQVFCSTLPRVWRVRNLGVDADSCDLASASLAEPRAAWLVGGEADGFG